MKNLASTSSKLLFFTYSDCKYDLFAIPYAYFALRNNPNSLVEISLENADKFFAKNRVALEILQKIYPSRTLFRQAKVVDKQKNIIPNTVRFIEKASLQAEYLYIGDIDLLVFDDVLRIHVDLIHKHNLPFSNILRKRPSEKDKPRLSGLHFINYDTYYPIPDLSDIDLSKENDEHVLYECMRRKGLMVNEEFQERPECGIHMSLSRDPAGRTSGPTSGIFTSSIPTGWGGRHYYEKFKEQLKEKEFCELLPHLDLEFKQLLIATEALSSGKTRLLHRLAAGYLLDKRLLISKSNFTISDFYAQRDAMLKAKDFDRAIQLGVQSTAIWPFNVDIWYKQAWLYMATGKMSEAVESLWHIVELPGGIEFLTSNQFAEINREKIESVGHAGTSLMKSLQH